MILTLKVILHSALQEINGAITGIKYEYRTPNICQAFVFGILIFRDCPISEAFELDHNNLTVTEEETISTPSTPNVLNFADDPPVVLSPSDSNRLFIGF